MVLVKVKRDITGGERYLKNALHYVFGKEDDKPVSISGNGVDTTSVNAAFEQMHNVKKYYGKTSGNPLVHLMVTYDNSVDDPDTAVQYTDEIADYFADRFQTLQCTHHEEQNNGKSLYHTHIVANAKFSIRMPDNFTPWFDLSDADKVARINDKADKKLRKIIHQIHARETGNFMLRVPPAFMHGIHGVHQIYIACYGFKRS